MFTMQLAQSQNLIYGNLQLIYPSGEAIDYLATSGCADWQRPGDEWVRGKGPLPAGEYQIPSEPYYLETRGVEGDFFHITPDPVISDDANVPGTAGCLALVREFGWQRFCDRMASIADLGVEFLPLTVKY